MGGLSKTKGNHRRRPRLGARGHVNQRNRPTTRSGEDDRSADRRPRKPPSARMVARLLTAERDRIPVAFASTMALIEQGVPTLIAARDLLDRFHAVIRTRAVDELDAWITAARENPLSSFANGIATDRDSVRAALVHPGAPRSRQVQPLGSLQSLPDAPLPAASASAPADRATRHHRLLLSSASTFCRFPAPGR